MYNHPLFAPKQTLARIDFLRLGERLVNEKGTHNVKISAEKWTETDKLGVDKLASWQVDVLTS